jgi:hypothetical protein
MKRHTSSGPVWRAPRIGDKVVGADGRRGLVTGTRLGQGKTLVRWNGRDEAELVEMASIDWLTKGR